MIYRMLIASSIAVLLSAPAFGQTAMPDRSQPTGFREEVFGLGLFGGPVGGLGVSFRHHLRLPLSYQITAGVIKTDRRLLYDVAIEGEYDISRGERGRFFVGTGFGYFYSGESKGNEMKGPFRLGIGGGAETTISPVLTGVVQLMFTYFSDGTVLPLPEVGVFYYF